VSHFPGGGPGAAFKAVGGDERARGGRGLWVFMVLSVGLRMIEERFQERSIRQIEASARSIKLNGLKKGDVISTHICGNEKRRRSFTGAALRLFKGCEVYIMVIIMS
jgi:hypothetical protein